MTDQPNLNAALRNLLEDERRRATGADEERKDELRSLISDRESELSDVNLIQAYQGYLASLPEEIRPQSQLEVYRMFPEWEKSLKQELADWKDELNKLESKVPNSREIYDSARERVLQALGTMAEEVGLFTQTAPSLVAPTPMTITANINLATTDISGRMSFADMLDHSQSGLLNIGLVNPRSIHSPSGNEVFVTNWADFLIKTAELMVEEGRLTKDECPIIVGNMRNRYLIHSVPFHPSGRKFKGSKRLSNGLHINTQWNRKSTAMRCCEILTKFGHDPTQFHVQLN